MSSPNGTRFESAVVKYLRAAGLQAGRQTQTKVADVGDVWLEDDFVLQAKDWQNIASALREGTLDAEEQATVARRPFGVAVIKKRRGPIAEAYVAMPLRVFAALVASRGKLPQ